MTNRKTSIDNFDEVIYTILRKDCLTVKDSYKIRKSKDMRDILNMVKIFELDNDFFSRRSIDSLLREWKCHNIAYRLGICRNRTKDVDFEKEQSLIMNIAYRIASIFYIG